MDELITVETKEQYNERLQMEMFDMFHSYYDIPEEELQRWEEYWDELARKGGEVPR